MAAACNTPFVWESELSHPVTTTMPITSHAGEIFGPREEFDVYPVIGQKPLCGITLRGREVSAWKLDAETDEPRHEPETISLGIGSR